MPTYEYRCTDCGRELEAVQKFSDPALTVCPACQGSLRKVYSPVGVVFKGSGFYRTDSRAKTAGADGSSEGTATADAGTKSDGTKVDAGKGDGAKGDGAKADGGKGDASGSKPAANGSSGGDGAKKATSAKKPAASTS